MSKNVYAGLMQGQTPEEGRPHLVPFTTQIPQRLRDGLKLLSFASRKSKMQLIQEFLEDLLAKPEEIPELLPMAHPGDPSDSTRLPEPMLKALQDLARDLTARRGRKITQSALSVYALEQGLKRAIEAGFKLPDLGQ